MGSISAVTQHKVLFFKCFDPFKWVSNMLSVGIGNFLAEISSSEFLFPPTASHMARTISYFVRCLVPTWNVWTKISYFVRCCCFSFSNWLVLAATAKSVKNVPKFVSLETKLHLERRGEPVIGLDQIEVIKPRTNPEMYEPKYRCTLCCVTAHTYCKIPSLTGYRTTLAVWHVEWCW